jgi:hypothetical protein
MARNDSDPNPAQQGDRSRRDTGVGSDEQVRGGADEMRGVGDDDDEFDEDAEDLDEEDDAEDEGTF